MAKMTPADGAPAKDNRDPVTGQFTPKEKPADAPAKIEQKPDGAKLNGQKPAPEVKPVDAPVPPMLSGLTKAAQADWAKTPETVRADVERRLGELTQGIEKYKADATAFEAVRGFDEMARKSGTTLDKALAAYTGIENKLSTDPVGGMFDICRNIGVDPRQMVHAMVQAINGGAAPAAQRQGDSPEVAALKAELAAIKGEVSTIGKTFAETQADARKREAQNAITKFAETHPYFDELGDTIAHMIETKFAKDLPDAYEKAVRLTPEVAAKIEADKAAQAAPKTPDPAQTRKAALSVTGSPTVGSHPSERKPAGSAREALQNAFAQVGG
jgi:hypothetical protein